MIKQICVFFASCMLGIQCLAASIIEHDSILAQQDCFSSRFESYEAWMNTLRDLNRKNFETREQLDAIVAQFRQKFSEADYQRFKANLDCSNVYYQVDGQPVAGYVIAPKHAGGDLPVLVYNRGGNANYSSVVFSSMFQNLFPVADRGFIIIGSQYGGVFLRPEDTTLRDEFGGRDVEDVVALFDLIPHIRGADAERVGMFGGSRGGMQSFLVAKEVDGIDAIATIAAPGDLARGLERRPEMRRVHEARIPGYENNADEELARRSVVRWADELPKDVPILLLHGDADERVHVEQAHLIADALEKAGHPHKLVVYSGDNHVLSQNRDKARDEIIAWFNEHLSGATAE